MPIRFDHPEWLWLLLLAVPIVLLGRRSLATMDPSRRWAAVGLRLVVLTVLVLMLADLQAVRWHKDLTVMAVVDQSQSIRRFAKPPAPLDAGDGAGRHGTHSRYPMKPLRSKSGSPVGWIALWPTINKTIA